MIGKVRRMLFTKRPSRCMFGCLVFLVGCDNPLLTAGTIGAIVGAQPPVIVDGCTTIDGVKYCEQVDCGIINCNPVGCMPVQCDPVDCILTDCTPVQCISVDCVETEMVVCHNGRTVSLTPGHLQHGDMIGPCSLMVCHEGSTIIISNNAFSQTTFMLHLTHGDKEGPCTERN